MIAILVYRDERGEVNGGIYPNVCDYIEQLDRITFTILHDAKTARSYTIKGRDLISFIPLEVKGRTYAERKADLQDKAIQWSYAGGEAIRETDGEKAKAIIKELEAYGVEFREV